MKPASHHPAVTGAADAMSLRAGRAARKDAKARSDSPPPPDSSYDVDDEVFFRHDDGPRSGRVVSRGKHGCTVDEPCGRRHQVAWGGFLGVKGRKSYQARMVERGAGGAIMEREDGKRFFVSGDVPAAEEPDALSWDESGTPLPLQKACPAALLGDAIARFGARWSAQALQTPARPLLFMGRTDVR